jgi:hypothetical protein
LDDGGRLPPAIGLEWWLSETRDELQRWEKTLSPFASWHEAESVLREEFEEFWAWVKRKPHERDHRAMCRELVQIAGVALRAARDLAPEEAGRIYTDDPGGLGTPAVLDFTPHEWLLQGDVAAGDEGYHCAACGAWMEGPDRVRMPDPATGGTRPATLSERRSCPRSCRCPECGESLLLHQGKRFCDCGWSEGA